MNISLATERRRWQVPPLDADDRWVGGVAAAIAAEIGVQPLIVRISFAILALAGGWGLVLYGLAWVALAFLSPPRLAPYVPVPKAASPLHRHVAVGLIVLGILLGLRSVGFGFGIAFVDQIVFPLGFVMTGLLVAWSHRRDEGGVSAVIRILAGVIIAGGGLVALVATSLRFTDALQLLILALAVVGGTALVVAPSIVRIGQDFDVERQERVRADERARVAAHLHDSVLQTLTLIQRNADDAQQTAQIARQQERELRAWLYGNEPTTPGTTRLEPALQEVAHRVEANHGVKVEVVTVGDSHDLDPLAIHGLVAATQEAVTNAAKHAGVAKIDVFAEHRPDTIEVFVRDAGAGFDLEAIDPDRQGIRNSILDRMERHGGSAYIHSEPGVGTEVELIQPITTTRSDDDTPGATL
ncbi:MAG: PspC domain-containing protein [Actinomycetota bacterium]